ncbi:MAG: hypothetical protein SGJ27_23455 [Candidatus Melainabacteria bacterium]|nr:hypothetical protein [Candidatus Melainabacteria bacterium]
MFGSIKTKLWHDSDQTRRLSLDHKVAHRPGDNETLPLRSHGPKSQTRRRNQRGASLFLIAGAALLICYLIYLGFQYAMVLGGSRQVRNGVDAAVLNLSKRVCEVKVQPNAAFADVADSTGRVSMANINRVWGKAYLINANVDEMKLEGTITGKATGAGELSYEMAQQINDDLRGSVTNKGVLDQLFTNLADKRTAPMLGADKINKEQRGTYPIALVDRGAESNLSFNPAGLPINAMPKVVKAGPSAYVQGYVPFKANSKTFCFLPFRLGETPHLISDSVFNSTRADSHPIPDFQMAIPNAFQGTGTAFGTGATLAAAASASVNPMRQYALAIPHSYIRINFTNISYWFIDSKKHKTIPYFPDSGQINGIKEYKLKNSSRVLNGFAELGTEFKKANILDVINALPGDHAPAMQKLLQRAQEIDHDFTLGQLRQLLQKQPPDLKVTSYYLFPRYSTADLTDPKMDIAAGEQNLPGWLNHALAAEGSQMDVVKEQVFMDYEHAHGYIYGGTPTDCPKWIEISGVCKWRPGTGMDQCLGSLNIDRTSTVKFKPGTED